ncbi:prolipoprotein diacylglyceryl transferase [Propionispora vibrioides]|uniref:Phosphatidylglycerol--prolipoprotein diacylglyceryl transferase n=1 Tax=Propionispora vibrioides TaxID=112903 RepID=A0A1H8NVZ2_9FIRM|nr:prolipoprotein diacylglyceryl transferase [Propionispora vibrioides]SEO33563.1 phosphatidylglycerol:prolipoprotein diacylglycerol transferase [Propionispora vibrioides]
MHQYLFFIGDFPIRAYGLILSLSIILATGTAYYFAKQDGRWHQHVPDMGIYCGIAGIIGARLWDVFFFDWGYYHNHLLEIPFVWQGGMAIQGGVFLGAIVGYLYTKRHQIDTWAFADIVAAPAIILGQALGRAANLLNGDAFGHPTGGNFGILYPSTTLAHQVYGTQPLWPAEIWESQLDIVIFVLLLLFRTTNHAKGQVFILYAVLYSTARFFLEYLRGDYGTLLLGLKSAQLTSLAVILAGICLFIWVGKYGTPIQESKKTNKR